MNTKENENKYCGLCPRNCQKTRATQNESGFCGVSSKLKIARYGLHFFEEPPITAENGSGTIFFCGCTLKCVFCQNYEVSRNTVGREIEGGVSGLVEIIKKLEDMGAENVNFVTPTQFSSAIVEALSAYKPKIPIIYNTHSYEKIEALEKLAPYVDVFLPDLKYRDSFLSKRYSACSDYFEVASKAIIKMRELKPDVFSGKKLTQGIIVRHLILPGAVYDTKSVLKFCKDSLPKGTMISLMSQYTPYGNIEAFPELNRKLTAREYNVAVDYAVSLDLNCFIQDLASSDEIFIPNWDY